MYVDISILLNTIRHKLYIIFTFLMINYYKILKACTYTQTSDCTKTLEASLSINMCCFCIFVYVHLLWFWGILLGLLRSIDVAYS